MATRAESPALVQLLDALNEASIPFMLAGMSAANLQGVLATTVDVDIWIGLPSRQYMRVVNVCHRLGATLRSPNKVYLADDTPVDFIYEVTGLASFQREMPKARWLDFHGRRIPVMPLELIRRSKIAADRDKDKLHVLLINQLLKCRRAAASPGKAAARQPGAHKRRRRRP
jgi:hypothetical protein